MFSKGGNKCAGDYKNGLILKLKKVEFLIYFMLHRSTLQQYARIFA